MYVATGSDSKKWAEMEAGDVGQKCYAATITG
jgi:hypothetical protein